MKKLIFVLSILLVLPMGIAAQTASESLQKVTNDIKSKKWSDAAKDFIDAIGIDVTRADIYYRAEVDKDGPVGARFAEELATYYKNTRNFGKAYNYYSDLLKKKPNDVSLLSGCAESAFGEGKEDEAVDLYEKVVAVNQKNLRANIFLGSYYFMQSEMKKKQLDNTFTRLTNPNSMQKARYKDDLKALYASDYLKASEYLQNVLKVFPSTEAKKMLETIAVRDKEIN